MSNLVTFVWRCDRCGREQPANYDPKAATQELPVQWSRLVEKDADLCRECTDALTDWLWHSLTVPVR